MRIDRSNLWHALRGLWLAGIAAAGLVSLVGSGGGFSLGFPPCDAYWCNDTPPPPQPTVAVQPPYVTSQVGATVTFKAETSNFSGTVSFQWSRSADGGTTYTDIAGATASSYSPPPVNLADDGAVFRVLAKSTDGYGYSRFARAHLAVSSLPGVVVQDGEFPPATWEATARANPEGVLPVHTEATEASGGNPGAWLRMVFEIPRGAGSASVSYLRPDARYDPATQGAIYVIDYAEDCVALQPGELTSVESGLVLEQAGRRYASTYSNTCTSTGWTPAATRASLGAIDFALIGGPACAAGESCPDFSAAAPPLRFGFRRITWGTGADVIGHGIDNWTVTVWRR